MDKERYYVILSVFLMVICLPALVVSGIWFYNYIMELTVEQIEAITYFTIHVAALFAAGFIGLIGHELWSTNWWG